MNACVSEPRAGHRKDTRGGERDAQEDVGGSGSGGTGTYGGDRLESEVVRKAAGGPDAGPVRVEGEVVVDREVNVREEGRHRQR